MEGYKSGNNPNFGVGFANKINKFLLILIRKYAFTPHVTLSNPKILAKNSLSFDIITQRNFPMADNQCALPLNLHHKGQQDQF